MFVAAFLGSIQVVQVQTLTQFAWLQKHVTAEFFFMYRGVCVTPSDFMVLKGNPKWSHLTACLNYYKFYGQISPICASFLKLCGLRCNFADFSDVFKETF